MKKRFLVCTLIVFVLLLSIISIFGVNYFIEKSESAMESKIIDKVKTAFLYELKLNNPSEEYEKSDFILLGQYGNGYILIKNNTLPAIPEINFDPVTTIIDDVSITYFPTTKFYYFQNNIVIVDLLTIYERNYVDKEDLKEISTRFEEWKDKNYLIRTDYKVDDILD